LFFGPILPDAKGAHMSVWPGTNETGTPALSGSEGDLVSISVSISPRDLEELLEALATLDFPINPQIYHDAAMVYMERDGREHAEPMTIVEFPAYTRSVAKIRGVLETCGFASGAVSISPMLNRMRWGGQTKMPVSHSAGGG
jgi:hypothetical protein